MTTASSIAESGRDGDDDLSRMNSYGEATPGMEGRGTGSAAPSPMLGSSSSIGKESFMQKLTRKSSAGGKFVMPTFKRERSRLDISARESLGGEDGIEEASLGASTGSGTRESTEGKRGSVRGWGNVLKFGGGNKGSGKATGSTVSVDASEDGEAERD
jgi:hypothetical protein